MENSLIKNKDNNVTKVKKQRKTRRPRSNSKILDKVSDEDFIVPKINEYDKLNTFNYNVKQLKAMCKHYKLKISGNKNELKKRISDYLVHSVQAITIQKIIRGYIVREYIKTHGPALFKKNECVNNTDFLTLDDLSDIPFSQFYSFRDKDDFLYGFDICSIYNLWKISKENTKNPYNRNPFPENTFNNMKRMYKFGKLIGIDTNITIDFEQPNQTPSQLLESQFMTLFQTIDELGFYTEYNWLWQLNRYRKVIFIRQLYDIWVYRANLTQEAKLQICPGNGNPFTGIYLGNLNNFTEFQITDVIYRIVNNLVTSGHEQSNRWMGASLALTALTLVSQDAAESLPWLYQSVA